MPRLKEAQPFWSSRKVVVTVGTGGVGKTTISASIALAAAATGRRTLVMTIDPARRLADALGMKDVGSTPRQLDERRLREAGIDVSAPLWVMMPDAKTTFDRLIERLAPNEAQRDAILANTIYQHFSTSLAGSLEYAAVECLYEMHSSGEYDLIVLDTPPAQSAVEFLDAPSRVIDFLEQETLQRWLSPYMAAGRMSLKLFGTGSGLLFRVLGHLTGTRTIRQLAEFLFGFHGMYDGFLKRACVVKELLSSEEVAFALVGSTAPTQRLALDEFRCELRERSLAVRAIVVNRVRESLNPDAWPNDWRQQIRTYADAKDQADALVGVIEQERALSERDQRTVEEIQAFFQDETTEIITLPELQTDVRDLDALARLYTHFR